MFVARFLLTLGAGIALAAQISTAQLPGEHPNRDFLKRAERETEVRFAGPTSPAPPSLGGRAIARIGTEDGEDAMVFGDMVDVTMLDDSTIAILDATAGEVRLFSTAGRHLYSFGRTGVGPGEFRGLSAIVRAPDGTLAVSDARRALQFFARSDRGYTYRRSMNLSVGVRSLCYVGRRLFVNGASAEDGKAIRELDDSGAVVRAFGEIYRSSNGMLNWQVAQGRILCDPERQMVYLLAGGMVGEVRAYRVSGEEVWRAWVSDYATNRILEQPQGGMSVQRSPVGAHSSAALTMTAEGQLLAQWLFISRAQMDAKLPGTQVHSVLLDPLSGRARNLGTGVPLVKESTSRFTLTYHSDPFSQLEVRPVRP